MYSLVTIAAVLLTILVTFEHTMAFKLTKRVPRETVTGDAKWEMFKSKYEKKYHNRTHERNSQKQFQKMSDIIETHNKEAKQGLHSYVLSVNKFTDWSEQEYSRMLGYRSRSKRVRNNITASYYSTNNFDSSPIPDEVDWRTQGYVTPVKSQAIGSLGCGGCWAFAATGALEGMMFERTGILTSLSEQNLIDCVTDDYGCGGGSQVDAFDYVLSNGGIDTARSYPFTAKDDVCNYVASGSGATISGYVKLPTGDEQALLKAVATIGPIAVSIDATSNLFKSYSGGIYAQTNCSKILENLDHSVLVVGYGVLNGTPYWQVKNSWGADWGNKGYFMLARTQNNMCGIATDASYPY